MAEIKPLADDNRVPLKDVVPLDAPFSVYVFPTNACNFRCTYCAQSLGKKGMKDSFGLDPESMTMETFSKVVEQLGMFPRRIKMVNLTGHGEPLVNPLLPDMIALLKRSNVAERIEFITNASLLTPELSHRLIDAGLDCIRISLQGLSAEKYREVCGYRLDFDQYVDNIRWFFEHRGSCKVFVKIMDIALDDGEEPAFRQMFSPIADRIFIEQCRPVYSGVKSTDGIGVDADRYGNQHPPRVVCPLCFFMLGVFPNGDISPCETIYLPERLGNVHETTLPSAWNGEKRRDFLRMQLHGDRKGHPRCVRCAAPDDVSHELDVLDDAAQDILGRLQL